MDDLIMIIGLFAALAICIFTIRFMERRNIRSDLAKPGFTTTAALCEVDSDRVLIAKNKHGGLLVAAIPINPPKDLTVEIKESYTPPIGNHYRWMVLSDGVRLPAKPI